MQANPYKPTLPGGLAVVWGVGGFFLLLTNAIVHLAAISLQAFEYALTPAQWAVLVANIMFMSYSEGYKGFQQHCPTRCAAGAK